MEQRDSGVCGEEDAEGLEDLRFGSPVKHRNYRDPGDPDEPEPEDGGEWNDTLPHRSGSQNRREASPPTTASAARRRTSSEELQAVKEGPVRTSPSSDEESGGEGDQPSHSRSPSRHAASPLPEQNEEAECNAKLVDEAPVTIANVNMSDTRRKRLKKVSHYVLGPLLGEGMYGVIRDAIDISAVPQCAAVQQANSSPTKCHGGGFSSSATGLPTHQQFHRCAVKMMPVPSGDHEHKSLMTGGKRHSGLQQNRAALLRAAFKKEVENLQRFHCPYIMRAIDLFSRHGKEYIVLPIAICSLQQFILRRREYARSGQQWMERNASPRPSRKDRDLRKERISSRTPIANTSGLELSDSLSESYLTSSGSSADGSQLTEQSSLMMLPLVTPYSSPVSSPRDPTPVVGSPSGRSLHVDPAKRVTSPRGRPTSPPCPEARRPSLFSATLMKGAFYQILSAVAYLHRQNLAHNDIKPSNILLFEDGSLRLTDLAGISAQYNDQGTPLFCSPELALHFYGCGATMDQSYRSDSSDGPVQKVDSRASDMWCCGLVLYALVTGRPGPLAIQKLYDEFHHDPSSEGQHYPMNRFQLYSLIAQQETPVDLSDVPHYTPSEAVVKQTRSSTGRANSLRDLLAGLLELDPARRLTAEEALRHPWMELQFVRRSGRRNGKHSAPESVVGAGADPASVDASTAYREVDGWVSSSDPASLSKVTKHSIHLAVQREVAQCVLASTHFKDMLRRDKERHLQFVADCCHTLDIPIPPEILITSTHSRPLCGASQDEGDGATMGKVVHYGYPAAMPPGCVDPALFLPREDADYYERKSGMPEFDLRSLLSEERHDLSSSSGPPVKVQQFEEYLHNVVMVELGHRTAPDPCYAAEGAGQFAADVGHHRKRHTPLPDSESSSDGLHPERMTAPAPPPSGNPSSLVSPASAAGARDRGAVAEEVPVRSTPALGRTRGRGRATRAPMGTAEGDQLRESSRCFCGLV